MVAFLTVAARRAVYPFELEWMEGGMLEHVRRVMTGEPLYAPPSIDFIAFPYTPLYVWLSALASRVAGAELVTLRGVSIASAVVAFVLAGRLVYARTRHADASLLAVGLFAASFGFTGQWFDLARVDSLFLACVLGAAALSQTARSAAGAFASGCVFALAIHTKQLAILPGAAVASWWIARDPRRAAAFLGGLVLVAGGLAWWLQRASDGWFRWHIVDLLAGHELHTPMLLGFWVEVGATLGPAFAVALWVRVAPGASDRDPSSAAHSAERVEAAFLPVLALALLASAYLGRIHVGGYDNTLLPAALAAALLGGEGLALSDRHPSRRRALIGFALVAQFVLLAYDPRDTVPSARDRAAGESLVAQLDRIEGELWAPSHSHLVRRTGRAPHAHAMGIIDLLQSEEREVATQFVRELELALARRRFAGIVLDDLSWEQDLPALLASYVRTRTLLDPADEALFRPVTGDARRPLYLYEPR